MHKKSTRKDRIEIFLDTQNWIKQDADLSVSVDSAKKNTEIFYEDEYPVFDRKLTHTVVKVSKNRSYQAAMRLSKRYNGKKIAVLNFANAFHAGGGVTSGAAMEAIFQGIPAIAFSEGTNDGYIITDLWLDKILSEVMNTELGTESILNVNFPTCKPEELKGILRNRFVSKSYIFKDHYICNTLPDGTKTYMVEGEYQEKAEEGSDLKALFDKYISIGTVKNIG